MIVNDFEKRGWKEICEFLGVQHKYTAKKRLKEVGLFSHDGAGKPVLDTEAYRIASLERHVKP